jgi:hypothetical protein
MSTRNLVAQERAVEEAFEFLVDERGFTPPEPTWMGNPNSVARAFAVNYYSRESRVEVNIGNEDGEHYPHMAMLVPRPDVWIDLALLGQRSFQAQLDLRLDPSKSLLPLSAKETEQSLWKAFVSLIRGRSVESQYWVCLNRCSEILRQNYEVIVQYGESEEAREAWAKARMDGSFGPLLRT